MSDEFSRDSDLSYAVKVYDLRNDPVAGRPSTVTIETLITHNGEEMRRQIESIPSTPEMALANSLPLSDFEAGDYSLQVTVTDTRSGATATSKSNFKVR